MFVYFHGTKDAYNTVQTFHKAEKAAEYVIAQIDAYIGGGKPTSGKKSTYKKARPAAAQFQQVAVNMAFPVGQHIVEQPIAMEDHDPLDAQQPAPPQPIAIQFQVADWGINQPKLKTKTEDNSKELEALIAHMVNARKSKTFDNATRAIELYEMYAKYVLNSEAALHILQEIKVEQ